MFRHIDKTQFQTLKKAMREARNKFIAHLDDEKVEYTPYMNIAKDTVRFYHSYIVENADPGDLAGLGCRLSLMTITRLVFGKRKKYMRGWYDLGENLHLVV